MARSFAYPSSFDLGRSLLLAFEEEFVRHRGAPCPSPHRLVLPKIVDLDETTGRFTYDRTYALKRPDWTYETPKA